MIPIGTESVALPTAASSGAVNTLHQVWEFRLFTLQDSTITVGMVVLGVVLFLVGFLIAKIVSALLARRVVKRIGATEGGIAAVQALTFYSLLVISGFFALNIIGIPLTAFTVLGGALAIGVGFGSQNIVNNFISGLILHLERPVKSGDVIEVAGTEGVVEQIGARSTRIITADNTHIIVPNSAFLEQNVINWSHNNRTVRIAVAVGVAYGSPSREVERLLNEVGCEHPLSLKSPEPNVRFDSFGDNAMNFLLHVWAPTQTPSDLSRMQSDLRFRIDEKFAEHGIAIAFPQRDVHLDAASPVPVQLVSAEA